MQTPSEFDDDRFQVAAAAKLSRQGIIDLQQAITNDRHELEKWLRVGGSPQQCAQWEASYRRKGRQLFWIGTQLGKIRDQQKAANRRANDKGKQKRRKDFYEAFFLLCRRELEPLDFKELCEAAREKAGVGPDDPLSNGGGSGVVDDRGHRPGEVHREPSREGEEGR